MIDVTDFIIKYPTKINAGAVAAEGINPNNPLKKREIKKRIAVVNEARPVLAPAATPEDDSTKEVTVDVPRHAPTTVPTESASNASLQFLIFPFSSFKLDCSATPINVPNVSNISVNKNVIRTTRNLTVKMFVKSNLNKYGASGIEKGLKFSGITVTPKGIPMIVVMIIPKSIEPGTLITYKTIVTTNPMIATKAVAFVRLKFTKPIIVPVEDEAIPALARPINAIKRPIPTETAF